MILSAGNVMILEPIAHQLIVQGLVPARYVVRLIVENEGGITATSEEVTEKFGYGPANCRC